MSGPAEPPKKWKPIFPAVTLEIEEGEERSGVVPFPGTGNKFAPKFGQLFPK